MSGVCFRPPGMNNRVSVSASNGAPPSPPRMGFVAGAEDKGAMNGYVGGKPATIEVPENPQSKRQLINYASPDPALAQSAFTQSLYTQNISAASLQSQEMRAQQQQDLETSQMQDESTTEPPLDARRASLRRFKESNGGGGGGMRGGSMMGIGSRFMGVGSGGPGGNYAPTSGRGQLANRGLQQQQQQQQQASPTKIPLSPDTVSSSSSSSQTTTTLATYTLADHNLMYKVRMMQNQVKGTNKFVKVFSDNGSWFRVLQIIVPQGKTPKKVYLSTMVVPIKQEGESELKKLYSLRIVNLSEAIQTPASLGPVTKTLWAEYDFGNTGEL